mgnify:CR=1 FL=1
MTSYSYSIHQEALREFLGARLRTRESLVHLFDQIAANPAMKGDAVERDQELREHQVIFWRDWEVTFWVDHPVREIKIVRLCRIQRI